MWQLDYFDEIGDEAGKSFDTLEEAATFYKEQVSAGNVFGTIYRVYWVRGMDSVEKEYWESLIGSTYHELKISPPSVG